MRVSEIMKKRMSFSFEVFPPKMEQPIEPLLETLDKLCGFRPDFISCTYGAGGTNKGRHSEILKYLADRGQTIPLAHFTCIGNTRQDILDLVNEYVGFGVDHFLALRGDYPPGQTGTGGDFAHGDELVRFLRENFPDLEIAAGCYPEKHLNSIDMDMEIAVLRLKQDAGADFLMTQLCHDVDNYCRFVEKARAAGITIPIDFGLMPVLAKDPTIRMAVSNGCSIPKELAEIIGKYGDNPDDFKKAGKEFTVKQIYRFISAGIDGLHIFALNKYDDVADILDMSGIRRDR